MIQIWCKSHKNVIECFKCEADNTMILKDHTFNMYAVTICDVITQVMIVLIIVINSNYYRLFKL